MSRPPSLSAAATRAVVLLALWPALLACGESEDGGRPLEVRTASNGDVYNTADVEFAQEMIPHHAEAIQMTVLAQDRPLDPEVAELADRIRETRTPEVEAMSDWLTAWGEEVPETSLDHANAGHGHEGMAAGMEELEAASDAEFQDVWLELMIEHHETAIAVARAHQEDGEYDAAVELAEAVEDTQSAEVEQMESLLG